MRSDKITISTVKQLVDGFYAKIRKDEALGPIFDEAIGTSDADWQPHLQTMYGFWSTLMCKTGFFEGEHIQYKGTPMQKHQALPQFDAALFDQWLKLFAETAHEIHTRAPAEQLIEASRRVAESLKLALYVKPANLPRKCTAGDSLRPVG